MGRQLRTSWYAAWNLLILHAWKRRVKGVLREDVPVLTKEKGAPSFDQTKAKMVAYIIVAILFGLMLVVGLKSSGGPQTFDGDKVEVRDCWACQGSGEKDGERCKDCLGNKKLKVIVPGPNHPVQVKGSVRDRSAFKDEAEAAEVAARDAADTKLSLKAVQGGIGRATILVKGQAGEIVLETKSTGKFKTLLKPGSYTLVVSAEGFKESTVSLEVPPREHPVWPKMPGRSVPEEDVTQCELLLEPAP